MLSISLKFVVEQKNSVDECSNVQIAKTNIGVLGYCSLDFDLFRINLSESNIPSIEVKAIIDNEIRFLNDFEIIEFSVEIINHTDPIELVYFDSINQLPVSKLTIFAPYQKALLECYVNDESIKNYLFKASFLEYFKMRLLFTPGIMLHAAAINWKGKSILFSASSGTGKSTQAKLWCQYENAEIINGDRPSITVFKDMVEVHGTPWSGSERIIRNVSAPVSCIIVLEQAKVNELIELSKEEAFVSLLPRFFMPSYNAYLTGKALDVIEQIIARVPIYKLKCRPDVGAVEVLKNALSLL